MSLMLVAACDDDNGNGDSKLVVINASAYEHADLWVVIHDAVTDSVLQVSHFTEPGSHEIPDVPDLFTMTLVQEEQGFVRFSTFLKVKRQVWNLPPLLLFVFPDGEVMIQVDLPDAEIERVTVSLPGSHSEAQIFEFEGETWAYASLGYLSSLAGKADLIVTGYGQAQSYANWLLDQTFTGEFDFRSVSLNRFANKHSIRFSSPVDHFDFLGYNSENGRWPFIFDEFEDTVQFTQRELVLADFPVEDRWLVVSTDGVVQTSYYRKFSALPDLLDIPQNTMSFDFVDSARVGNIGLDGTADAIAAYWSASSFEHSVGWTVYAPSSSDSIVRPALPDSVVRSVGVWADFEPRTLSLYEYQPTAGWDPFVREIARGKSIFESPLTGAFRLTHQLYESSIDSRRTDAEDLVSQQLAITPK